MTPSRARRRQRPLQSRAGPELRAQATALPAPRPYAGARRPARCDAPQQQGSIKIRGVKRRNRPRSESRKGTRGRQLDVRLSMSATLTPRILMLPYYAVPGSGRFICGFVRRLLRMWHRALRRRSQRDRFAWKKIERMKELLWPPVTIRHPWPNRRFAVKHPR